MTTTLRGLSDHLSESSSPKQRLSRGPFGETRRVCVGNSGEERGFQVRKQVQQQACCTGEPRGTSGPEDNKGRELWQWHWVGRSRPGARTSGLRAPGPVGSPCSSHLAWSRAGLLTCVPAGFWADGGCSFPLAGQGHGELGLPAERGTLQAHSMGLQTQVLLSLSTWDVGTQVSPGRVSRAGGLWRS